MFINKSYGGYSLRIVVEIMVLAIFLLPSVGMVRAETTNPNVLQETQLPDALQMLGRLEANGTHFELKNSSYLNITLDSSEPINLTIESPPEMVTMRLESLSSATTTNIIMRGFAPQTTYQKYEDDYHNLVTFTTDDSGSYAYTQDLSKPHLVFIQPVPSKVSKTSTFASAADTLTSTIFIRDDVTGGNCTLIGTWDNSTKTCTLTTNLAETVQIDNDGITLNGNGHIIMGSGTGSGVYLQNRDGVTIKNLTVMNFTNGIFSDKYLSHPVFGNVIIDNIIKSNYGNGIYLLFDGNTSLTNNTVYSNGGGIIIDKAGIMTLNDNSISYNGNGINLAWVGTTTLQGNNVSNNAGAGILSYQGGGRLLKNNIINSNGGGITIRSGVSNTLINNIVNSNYRDGIYIFYGYERGKNIL